MTRDDIIRMAKEAGFEHLVAVESNFVNPRISELFNSDGTGSLTKFAQLVAAHEREEAAKIADSHGDLTAWDQERVCSRKIAEQIRART